ncbi:MAG TPA: hypothetical protein VHZ33_24540 [Trebonia sp.]|nr:hypothetical protein [Trebonia sp.]
MRRGIPVSAYPGAVVAVACVLAGLAAVPAAATSDAANAAALSGPSAVSLPITGYYQMAVDSADDQVFISQGTSGGSSIVVADFSGHVVGSIAEPAPVAGLALAPDGTALYAVVAGSTAVSPEISVIGTSSLTQTATLPLPVGDTPFDVAVQSDRLWVSYTVNAYTGGIGYFDLSASSPTLQTPLVMSHYAAAPMLTAGPRAADQVLVAVPVNEAPPDIATYDTSVPEAQSGGYPSECNANVADFAVTPTTYASGDGVVLACDSATAQAEHVYSTSEGSEEYPTYPTIGAPNSVAVAPAGALVAVGGADATQVAEVYTQGGNLTNEYQAVGGSGTLASRGLGLSADGGELFAVTSVPAGDGSDFSLNTYPDPSITPTSVTLDQPASTTAGKPITITGTLLIGGVGPDNTTSITITRTGGGRPAETFAAAVNSAGGFTWIDYAPAAGPYTYTANYPATATSAASSASVTVTVARARASLSLTASPATAAYGQAVSFNALVQTDGNSAAPMSTLTVYAQSAGGATRTRLASRQLGGSGNIAGTVHLTRSTTLYAVFAGNAFYDATTVQKTVNVEAKVTAEISGYYGAKQGYRLYHRAARLMLTAAVAPAKKGECVQFQVQEYVKKSWRAVVTTGCATLNAKSQASDSLSLTKYALAVPYRVRADYIRGKDTANLDADSGFLQFMAEK